MGQAGEKGLQDHTDSPITGTQVISIPIHKQSFRRVLQCQHRGGICPDGPAWQEVTKPVYDWIGSTSISSRTAAARLDGRCGYIDLEEGDSTLSYDDAFLFCYGRGAVSKDGKWGYVDRNGREVIGHPMILRAIS